MEKIKIANSYGVNILGVHIPKNAIYGCIPIKEGRMYYYCTDYNHIENDNKKYINIHVCYFTGKISPNKQVMFSHRTIGKNCILATLILNYVLENVRHGTRCEYSLHTSNLMKHPRKHKHSSGGQIEHKHSITDYECTNNPLHDFRRTFY